MIQTSPNEIWRYCMKRLKSKNAREIKKTISAAGGFHGTFLASMVRFKRVPLLNCHKSGFIVKSSV